MQAHDAGKPASFPIGTFGASDRIRGGGACCSTAVRVAAVLTLAAGILSAQNTVDTTHVARTAWVIDEACRVYEHPDPFATVLFATGAGDSYHVIEQSEGWYEVALPGSRTGWIAANHAVLSSTTAGGRPHVAGSGGEVRAALGGALVGGVIGIVPLYAFMAYTFGQIGLDLFTPVHGSDAVSGTTTTIAFTSAIVSLVVATPAAAAYGAYSAGEQERPGGSLSQAWGAALVGNLAGYTVGFGLDELLSNSGLPAGLFTTVGSVAGTTTGAVLGYEHSKPANARHYASVQVGLPSVALAPGRTASGQVSPVVRANLVDLRF